MEFHAWAPLFYFPRRYLNLTTCVNNLHYEKFQDGTVKCIEDEIPFEVPEGWAWSIVYERERELNARISELQQAEELAKKRDTLVSEVTSLRNQVESLKIKVDVFLNSAKEDMLNKKKDFDEFEYLVEAIQ